ncbi:hypothetical protein [Gordonia aichiensis]|uniref:hypothetical protein n=1 Tax=Gordonia aichiensis TaxID=36820 RepID=UPI0032633C6C
MATKKTRTLTDEPGVIAFAELWKQKFSDKWLNLEWVESIGYLPVLRSNVADYIARYGLDCTVDELLDAVRTLTSETTTSAA